MANIGIENFSDLGRLVYEDIRFVASGTSNRNVYCDMDGVLVNFMSGIRSLYPQLTTDEEIDQFLKRPQAWKEISDQHPDLFAKLPVLADAPQLISTLRQLDKTGKINLFFLTALPPNLLHTRAVTDKKEWIRRHFNFSTKRVIVVRRKDKASFPTIDKMDGRLRSILIDDFGKNVGEWNHAGGIGIRHTSAPRSIQQLKKALQVS